MRKGFSCLRSGKKTKSKKDEGIQCQRNWNAAPSPEPSTLMGRQNYRHLFLIRHGKYLCKDSLSAGILKNPESPIPTGGAPAHSRVTVSRSPTAISAGSKTLTNKPSASSNTATNQQSQPTSHYNPRSVGRPQNTSHANEVNESVSRKLHSVTDHDFNSAKSNASPSTSRPAPGGTASGKSLATGIGNEHNPQTINSSSEVAKIMEGALSDMGRQQMRSTAYRLKRLMIDFNKVYVSELLRAKESGEIVAGILEMMEPPEVDNLLNEGTFPPESINSSNPANAAEVEAMWNNFPAKRRFEVAYQKYAAKPPKGTEDVFDILVCHCNIIKHFIHKALGVDTLGLKRLSNCWFPCHASITIVSISTHGQVFIRALGDSGHLEPNMVTVNNINSDVFWNSWIASAHPALPNLPPPITTHSQESANGRIAQRFATMNTASHATNESDFRPSLNAFEALVIGNGRRAENEEDVTCYRQLSSNTSSSGPPPKIWNRLSFEDYRECCNAIAGFIRERDGGRVTRFELFDWLVTAQRDTLLKDCRESAADRREMTRVVIDRLIDVDLVLVQETTEEEEEEIINVHPNFDEA